VSIKRKKYNISKLVGKGYGKFWKFKGRYRVVKGSRRSKKSKTMALWSIYNLMKYKDSNLLVVRKTYRTLKDSCFTELKWAIRRLGVEHLWNVKESPLEMTYIPTGQKIYFRGLDDPLKITSISVEIGVLCWMWIEEAYEITNEDDFDTLAESMLGDCPPGLFKQITLTFNPWSEKTWIKKRFFDCPPSDNVLAMTTTYECNEWLSLEDLEIFEEMKENNPRRYRVAGLGEWGIVDGLVYENWVERTFDIHQLIKDREKIKSAFGLDFGYTNDPSAFFCGMIDQEAKEIYVFDEFYKRGMQNEDIYSEICKMGYRKERITGDSAEPKSIDRLRILGLPNIEGARKGKDSVMNGIDFIQGYTIIVHPQCVNFITEISNYVWAKDKFGKTLNQPIDDFNHLMDAMRYALERHIIADDWLI
jgi:phage terminase large subunit